MTRRHREDPERWAHQRQDPGGLPLFENAASVEAGMAALRETAAKNEAMILRLAPLALYLARQADPQGVTVSNLRLAAVARGLLTGTERGRALSYLGAVMKRAGLVPLEGYQRSAIVRSHGNLNREWGLPEHREGAA